IVGTHYYLELRKLLKEKKDAHIERKDYIALVDRVERNFLAGVQRNLRTRVASNIVSNLKMMILPNHSRSLRLGELYEKEIFSKVDDKEGGKARWLNELSVKPMSEEGAPIEDFSPKYDNWRRAAKVP